MKISITAILLISLSNHTSSNAQSATQAHKDSLHGLVIRYYELNLKILQPSSTVEDIDKIFELFTDDFVYIHPKYGGTYTREVLYNGYVRNQKNGGYDGSTVDVKIENIIIGLNAVTTQRVYYQKSAEGELTEIDPGMTLFEFKNGKISKIFEYW